MQGWLQAKQQGMVWQYCRANFLSNQTLQAIDDIRLQLGELIVDAGFLGAGLSAGALSRAELLGLIVQRSPHSGAGNGCLGMHWCCCGHHAIKSIRAGVGE